MEKPSFPNAHSRRTAPQSEQRQPIPATRDAARAARPWFEQRATDAYRRYQAARAALEQARGELDIVRAVENGEFDDNDPETLFAVGSGGPWCVDLDARYSLVNQGQEALA